LVAEKSRDVVENFLEVCDLRDESPFAVPVFSSFAAVLRATEALPSAGTDALCDSAIAVCDSASAVCESTSVTPVFGAAVAGAADAFARCWSQAVARVCAARGEAGEITERSGAMQRSDAQSRDARSVMPCPDGVAVARGGPPSVRPAAACDATSVGPEPPAPEPGRRN
jgi:hypothetical protein